MKMKLALLGATASFLLLSSCKKEATDPNANINPNRVKSYTESITSSSFGNSSTTFNITYDNNGRITTAVSASSSGDKFVYSYPSGNKYTMDLYTTGIVSLHEDFFLNADLFIDSTFQYNDTEDTTTEKYTYNANKQLISMKEYEYEKATGPVLSNTTSYTYDANGNLIKTMDTEGQVETYEYYSDLSNILPVIPGPATIFSTKKLNLVKKHTITSNGYLAASTDITYTFDDKDRISTEKSVSNYGNTVVKTYTYL